MRPVMLILALLTACSCVHEPVHRNPERQALALVRIETVCPDGHRYGGSGVLISPTKVLTANHVVTCSVLPEFGISMPATDLKVFLSEVEVMNGSVETQMTDYYVDLATVTFKEPTPYFSPISVGPKPRVGERVCEVSVLPRQTYRCGEVQPSGRPFIVVDFLVENGNSGSGLYNEAGQLVGIVVRNFRCQDNMICGGHATALESYATLVP